MTHNPEREPIPDSPIESLVALGNGHGIVISPGASGAAYSRLVFQDRDEPTDVIHSVSASIGLAELVCIVVPGFRELHKGEIRALSELNVNRALGVAGMLGLDPQVLSVLDEWVLRGVSVRCVVNQIGQVKASAEGSLVVDVMDNTSGRILKTFLRPVVATSSAQTASLAQALASLTESQLQDKPNN